MSANQAPTPAMLAQHKRRAEDTREPALTAWEAAFAHALNMDVADLNGRTVRSAMIRRLHPGG